MRGHLGTAAAGPWGALTAASEGHVANPRKPGPTGCHRPLPALRPGPPECPLAGAVWGRWSHAVQGGQGPWVSTWTRDDWPAPRGGDCGRLGVEKAATGIPAAWAVHTDYRRVKGR